MRFLSFLPVIAIIVTVYCVASVQVLSGHNPESEDIVYMTNPGSGILMPETCRFRNQPEVIRNEPDVLLQYWIEAVNPDFSSPTLPATESLHEFRDHINQLLNTDPLELLAAQRSRVNGGDAVNVDLVLAGEAGTIRKMSCLEGLLLSVQTERSAGQGISMYSDPTEFMSYILTRGDSLKIYYYTVDQPGIRGLSVFDELLDQDRADGWAVSQHIHNHNFFPGSEMVLGGVVPSIADIGAYRNAVFRYGLSGATITNGFHSVDLTPDEFKKFSAGDQDGK